jgi:hypothetical protein
MYHVDANKYSVNGPEHVIVHLGYIPRSRGNNIGTLQVRNIMASPDWTAGLDFDMTGDPLVRITVLTK